MAIQISKLSVILTGSAAGFVAMSNTAKGALGGLTSAFSSTTAKITGLAAALGIGLSVSSLVSWIKSNMDSIVTLKHHADALGITTDALSKLQYAASFAGIAADDFDGLLKKMLKHLNEAASGTGPAAVAIETLGLNISDLLALPADQQLSEIAGAFSKIEDPAQRVGIATNLFGKEGAAIIPILLQGKDAIAAYGVEAEKAGVAVKGMDADSVLKAAEALKRLHARTEGLGNALAIQLSPFIEAAVNKFIEFKDSGSSAADKVTNGIEMVVHGIAVIGDWLNLAKIWWKGMQIIGTASIGAILKAFDLLGETFIKVKNFITGGNEKWDMPGLKAAIDGAEEDILNFALEAGMAWNDFKDSKNSKAVTEYFEDLRDKAHKASEEIDKSHGPPIDEEAIKKAMEDAKKVDDTLEKMRDELATFGMTDIEKQVFQLKKLGAAADQIGEAQGIDKQLEALKRNEDEHKKMLEDASKMYDDTRTSAEKYAAEIENINDLLTGNYITQEEAARAAAKAQDELTAAVQGQDQGAPKLLQAGSQEAVKFVNDVQRQQRKDAQTEQVVKGIQTSNSFLSKIVENTSGKGGIQALVGDF